MRKTFLFILALCATMMAWGEAITVTKTATELAALNGWKSTGIFVYGNLDDICYLSSLYMCPTSASSNLNGYYQSSSDTKVWRMYEARHADGLDVAQFTLNVVAGYVLKSATITYTVSNTGIIKYNGSNVTSGSKIEFSGKSPIEIFTIGNTGTVTNGQVHISSIEVIYEKKDVVVEETFTAPDGTEWSFTSAATENTQQGKDYKWTYYNCRYDNDDSPNTNDQTKSHGQGIGMWLANNSYIFTTAEGGVKAASFWWNQANAKESDKLNGMTVLVDDVQQIQQTIKGAAAADRLCDVLTTIYPQSKTNSTFKITVNGLGEARFALGHITIVPYLLFTQKTAEVDALEQNNYTYPADKLINNTEEGTVTYSITSNSGATINAATGEVNLTTVTSAATDTITATWGEVTTTYSLTISYTAPAEGTYWKEGFSNFKAEGYTGYTTNIAGDYGIVWTARNFRHKTSDESDKVDGEYGVRLKYAGTDADKDGYIETSSLEGGVKRLQFKWKTPSNSENPKFTVELDGETAYTVDQPQTKEQSSTEYDFGYNANIAKNAKFTIRVTSGTCASIFGPLTIVPYLYYKTKSHTIDNAIIDGTYTNTDLINNIDNNEGTITYSLISEGADDIASINASTGEVTVKAGGVVTVQAKWVPEGAGEDEFVTTTYELTINFPQPTITFNDIEVALDGTVTPDITVVLNEEDITETATISYEVADENIATWDATNGWKLKTNGTTQVTANVARTAQYGAASATATMTVNTMTFAEGTFFTENFGGEATSSYSTQTEDWRGKDNVYPWTFLNWRRYADHVRITMTKPGSSNINGYIYMNPFDDGALEGGIKAVQVTWSAPGASSLATDFYVDDIKNSSATKVTIQKEAGASADQQITQAIFNSKTNKAQLRIRIGSLNKSAIDVYSVDIVPYLLYTKKKVSVTYDLEGTNEVDVTENLINNLEEDETVTYSLSAGAQATIDGSTITLANATEDVIVTATCGEVSTTFTLKVTKAASEWDYTRVFGDGEINGTICVDHNMVEVQGATLWKLLNYEQGMSLITIEQVEVDNTEAGVPYIYERVDNAAQLQIRYGESVDEAKVVNGLHGTLTKIVDDGNTLEGNYAIYNNEFRLIGTGCILGANKAYMVLGEVGNVPPVSGAPRRAIRMPSTPTNLVGSESERGKALKVMRDGQFYIIRDTKTYNAQGILVE